MYVFMTLIHHCINSLESKIRPEKRIKSPTNWKGMSKIWLLTEAFIAYVQNNK